MPIRYADFIDGPSTLNLQIGESGHNVRSNVCWGRGRDPSSIGVDVAIVDANETDTSTDSLLDSLASKERGQS